MGAQVPGLKKAEGRYGQDQGAWRLWCWDRGDRMAGKKTQGGAGFSEKNYGGEPVQPSRE